MKTTSLPRSDSPLYYHPMLRALHWIMAWGFIIMWLTGVLVTNIEGVPFFVDEDRQGLIRDFHKSVGYTLLMLLLLRLGVKLTQPAPAAPLAMPLRDRRLALAGHAAIYLMVVAVCMTGIAIADLHEYGNAYFGIELPQLFPTREQVLGWASTPWAYVLHAALAYGLLALSAGHIAAVWLHARSHKIELLPRMYAKAGKNPAQTRRKLTFVACCIVLLVAVFALRGFVTLGELEAPRDYRTTTPFR